MFDKEFRPLRPQSALIDPVEAFEDFERNERLVGFVGGLDEAHPLHQSSLDLYESAVNNQARALGVYSRYAEVFSSRRTVLRHPLRALGLLVEMPKEWRLAKTLLVEAVAVRLALLSLRQVNEDIRRGRTPDEVIEDCEAGFQLRVDLYNQGESETYSPYSLPIDELTYRALHGRLAALARAAVEYEA